MTIRYLVSIAVVFLFVTGGGWSFADDISIANFESLAFRHIGPEGNRTIAAAGVSGDSRPADLALRHAERRAEPGRAVCCA